MQKSTENKNDITFFAAANGYGGFRSYFGDIFDSKNYESVFILKGGPGTGKSSLMREIALFGAENGYECEKILCSSDPHSLDGVILGKGTKSFAVLDGTAPHTRDAEIPGAIDEIINLGENWDSDILKKNKNLIFELSERKKSNYSLAYKYLAHAGKIEKIKHELEIKRIKPDNLKLHAKREADSLSRDERRGNQSVRLVSSFGRFGKFRTDTLEHIASRTVKIKDHGLASHIYMKMLADELAAKEIKMTVFPSALDGEKTEAVFLHESATAVVLSDSDSADIFPDELCTHDPSVSIPDGLIKLGDTLISEAQRFFTFASDMHFELEKIYMSAMNFPSNAAFSDKIIKTIKNLSD